MKLNRIFSSNMVFAANKPIRVYGSGKGSASISFAGATKGFTSEDNFWVVELPEMDYGGPFELIFKTENETVTLTDIYIGEVYLLSGQSNMQFKLREAKIPTERLESNNLMRVYGTETIEKKEFFTPESGWVKCDRETASEWSAIGYFTAREIVKSKNIAVGVINCYQGASVIEGWLPEGTLERLGITLAPEDLYPTHTIPDFAEWCRDGALYEKAFCQVVPFSLSAVVWYQGESDSSIAEARVYKQELAEMIRIWRSDLRDPVLPFIVIQIADHIEHDNDGWRGIQQAQLEISSEVEFVKTVISRDVCENDDVHPPTKDILSKRIARALTE